MTTKEVIERIVGDRDPQEINSGDCGIYAVAFAVATGGEVVTMPHHSLVRVDGRYYDSAMPDGVDDVNDLPIMERLGESQLTVGAEFDDEGNFIGEVQSFPQAMQLAREYATGRTQGNSSYLVDGDLVARLEFEMDDDILDDISAGVDLYLKHF